MPESQFVSSSRQATVETAPNCEDAAECCQHDSDTREASPPDGPCADDASEQERSHSPTVGARIDGELHSDGAGEPCPAPLLWQEIRERFLLDSTPWEVVRGRNRLVGRTWGTGTPLYFLNNFAATAELFSLTAWLLRDEFRCVVFDTSTVNHGAAGRTPPTMTEFADDLFAVADQHGDERIALYGAAFGAATALQAAIDRPQRVERLLLQHGFAARSLSVFERLLASVCHRSSGNLNGLPQRRRFQAVNHQPWFPPFDHSRFEFFVDSTGLLPLRDLARRALAVNSFNVVARLCEIDCPVLLLHTEGEGKVAAESQAVLERELRHCRIEWMHSAGQHPYLTHPHRVAKLVKSFCEPNSSSESLPQ